jgi:cobalt transporter subunit CbtB
MPAIAARRAEPSALVRQLPAFALLIFGAVVIYGVGFLPTSAVHNAAHDTRHAAGFPCH